MSNICPKITKIFLILQNSAGELVKMHKCVKKMRNPGLEVKKNRTDRTKNVVTTIGIFRSTPNIYKCFVIFCIRLGKLEVSSSPPSFQFIYARIYDGFPLQERRSS